MVRHELFDQLVHDGRPTCDNQAVVTCFWHVFLKDLLCDVSSLPLPGIWVLCSIDYVGEFEVSRIIFLELL